MENQNPKRLLQQVKKLFFKGRKVDALGKFEWLPVSSRQRIRYFNKTGKELTNQYRKYQIKEIFTNTKLISGPDLKISRPNFEKYYYLLISEIDIKESTFYVIGDNCVGPLIGEKMRYKFRLQDTNDKITIELLEKKLIAIR